MRLIFKEGPDLLLNNAVAAEIKSLQVDDFKVIPYEGNDDNDVPVLIAEDESGNEAARFINFQDMGELTDFIWDSF